MVFKRKALIKQSDESEEQSLLYSVMDRPDLQPHAPRVLDAIRDIKEQLLRLHDHSQVSERVFRLSFSILALEKSIDERQLGHIELDKAPSISLFIDRIHAELAKLRDRSEPTPSKVSLQEDIQPVIVSPPVTPYDSIEPTKNHHDAGLNGEIVEAIHEILATSRILKKNAEAENRKFYASTAAQYATIQRLSERMGRIEELISAIKPSEDTIHVSDPPYKKTPADPTPIDPRPLLMAARAAAARALADGHNAPPPELAPIPDQTNEQAMRVAEMKPSMKPQTTHRFWKSIFAVA